MAKSTQMKATAMAKTTTKNTMKKPAARKFWEETRPATELNDYGLANTNVGEQAEDAPDGQPDSRSTSRAQRHVWKRNMHLASDEDRKRFEYLKSRKNARSLAKKH